MASRLILLQEKQVSADRMWEVFCWIMGKVVMSAFFKNAANASVEVQMCGGSSGSEAAIHAMRWMFQIDNTYAVILVHASNTFNNLKRNALLHKFWHICPEIKTYVKNHYWTSARLFAIWGLELKSCELSTQCDPLEIAIYAIGITQMMKIMLFVIENDQTRMVECPDDITAAGELRAIRKWWKIFSRLAWFTATFFKLQNLGWNSKSKHWKKFFIRL